MFFLGCCPPKEIRILRMLPSHGMHVSYRPQRSHFTLKKAPNLMRYLIWKGAPDGNQRYCRVREKDKRIICASPKPENNEPPDATPFEFKYDFKTVVVGPKDVPEQVKAGILMKDSDSGLYCGGLHWSCKDDIESARGVATDQVKRSDMSASSMNSDRSEGGYFIDLNSRKMSSPQSLLNSEGMISSHQS